MLLSGFEPFGGDDANPSRGAVQLAAAELSAQGICARAICLPVEFARAGQQLVEHAARLRPQVVVATGLATGRSAVTPERIAINVRDARIPDNAGASPVDEPCVPGGPAAWLATLPVKAMVAEVQAAGLPAAVSQTAGTYVCNDVFAQLMHALDTIPALSGTRGGFVHVPAPDVLSVQADARALVLMVRAALEHTADIDRAGGTES